LLLVKISTFAKMAEASGKACEACERPVSFAEELDIGHGSVVHLKCFKVGSSYLYGDMRLFVDIIDRAPA